MRVLSFDEKASFQSITLASSSEGPDPELVELRRKVATSQEEIYKLQAAVTDVTEVNKRWQKYNKERQVYVQRLLSTIQEQQEQLNRQAEQAARSATEPQNSSVSSLESVREENRKLRLELSEMRQRLEDVQKEYKEQAEALQFQVKAHKDDWEAEKSDKEGALKEKTAAETRIKELENEVVRLKQKLREEDRHRHQEDRHRHSCHCCGVHICNNDRGCSFLSAPDAALYTGSNHHGKTYRTSVHLPCTSGQLLSRRPDIYFGEDLTTDGRTESDKNNQNIKSDEQEEIRSNIPKQPEITRSRSNSVESDHGPGDNGKLQSKSISARKNAFFNLFRNNERQRVLGDGRQPLLLGSSPFESFEVIDKYMLGLYKEGGKEMLNEDNTTLKSSQKRSSDNKRSSPIMQPRNKTPSPPPDCISTSSSGTLTIGFDNGLASVTSFSFLPTDDNKLSKSVKSADSKSSIVSVESSSVKSDFKTCNEIKTDGVSKPHSTCTEDGVDTETREDVICPGCGDVFLPDEHLKFLDHFEECQNTNNHINQSKRTTH